MKEKIYNILQKIIEEKKYSLKGNFSVFPSDKKEFGDFSTNVALRIMIPGIQPQTTAEEIAKLIRQSKDMCLFEKIEVRNGFINFFLKNYQYQQIIENILAERDKYGSINAGKNQKILIEFVSANPTGPLTIAHGRQAAYGEALSRILKFAGYQVTKEYYLNDCGRQMDLLGESLKANYYQIKGENFSIPEDGYQGGYLKEIAKMIPEEVNDTSKEFWTHFAEKEILNGIKKDLLDFGISFDSWVRESSLRENGKVEEIIDKLKSKELIYEKENALWFSSTSFGDDKDRVLKKQDGSYTYFAPDIAYHYQKIEKGYNLLVDIWGPDHFGYIPRLKAALKCFGFSEDKLKVIIVQLTTLYRGKEKISMSTRKDQFISLRQLMDEVGSDATKFFYLFRKAESHLDFDLELAKKRTEENPVYYIQYAYVRASHIIKFAQENSLGNNNLLDIDISVLDKDEEKEILKKIAFFPEIIKQISLNLQVSGLAQYLLEVSNMFHSYYQKYRIVTSEDKTISHARIMLVECILRVLSNGLTLLGISLPEKM
ncbi:MAG: arginine--tRNA ligase [Candidatus Omnitrophica bacterium]|jgi:arginyl-tRNA synthetase|nr:arginine--tRNA ligase [Candidatus Omnitrophota bacterium]